jgi:hypothetical protein
MYNIIVEEEHVDSMYDQGGNFRMIWLRLAQTTGTTDRFCLFSSSAS